MLLKWRLATFGKPLRDIQLPVKGRLKELWKPVIQVIAGLPVEKRMRQFLKHLQSERLKDKQNTLEGHIVKVVTQLYEKGKSLPFIKIWDSLVDDLEGYIGHKPHEMSTADFGIVTKQKVGYRLREVLGGKSRAIRTEEGVIKAYDFDDIKLERIVKKYGIVTKLPSSPTPIEETLTHETDREVERIVKDGDLSLQIEKLSNLVTTKENLKRFLFELRRNSTLSNTVPEALFNELVKKYNVAFGDLLSLSQSGIMKTSFVDNIECEPGLVKIRWVKRGNSNVSR